MTRILLIEDDPDTGASLQAMLELLGHAVHWAKNGREAIDALAQDPDVDVVLTDILMPEMDGLESIQHFRKARPDLPLVAMTAQWDTPYLRAASLFGAKVTLQKPFGVQQLQAALNQALAAQG